MREIRKPVKKVLLETDKISQEFEVSHAERILDMGPAVNGGWRVPEDSDYEYTEAVSYTHLTLPTICSV